MSQIFISHAEEDQAVAVELGEALERRGFSTWYYERDSVPGVDYLDQVCEAIQNCQAFILVVTTVSVASRQVNAEVVRAHETNKNFVPVLQGISHFELQKLMPRWSLVLGGSTSISIPPAGLSAILDRIETGMKKLGVRCASSPEPSEEPAVADEPPHVPAEESDKALPARPEESAEPPHASEEDSDESHHAAEEVVTTCTVFAPKVFPPGKASLIQVWLHTPDQAEEVEQTSTDFDSDAQRRGSKAVEAGPAVGRLVRFRLDAGDLPVRSLDSELTWDGTPSVAVFSIKPPEESPRATKVGRITLSQDGVPLASLVFKVRIADEEEEIPAPASQSFVTYRKAFISYASEDRAEVLRRVQMLSTMNISFNMDALNIRPGEEWATQLPRMIDEADVFLLFWSEAAKHSKWVQQEVDYALRTKGLDFIVPVALSFPIPPPPPKLASLHFNPSMMYLSTVAAAKDE